MIFDTLRSKNNFSGFMKLGQFYKKNSIKEGDLIEFDFNESKVRGTVIPSNDNTLMVKLSSGYNAGFEIQKIKKVKWE